MLDHSHAAPYIDVLAVSERLRGYLKMAQKKSRNGKTRKLYVTEWRKHFDLSGAELARRAGMTDSFLNQIEKGISGVSLDTLDKLADAMHISAGMLLDTNPQRYDLEGVSGDTRWVAEVKHIVEPLRQLRVQLEAGERLLLDIFGLMEVIEARVEKRPVKPMRKHRQEAL